MNLVFGRFAGAKLLSLWATSVCLLASVLAQQNAGRDSEVWPGLQMPASSSDFEVKINEGKFLVQQQGSQEWKSSMAFDEPIAVGLLDGDHKIYVMTKAIKAPKGKHTKDPHYPTGERKSGREGQVALHMVVDEHGRVRFPIVDASTSPEFAESAIDTVKKWTFEPAQLNGRPVAVLMRVEVDFKLRR